MSGRVLLGLVLLLPASAWAATPTLVQRTVAPMTNGLTATSPFNYNFFLPNKSLSGNCLILAFAKSHDAVTVSSVTDDQSQTYTARVTLTTGTGMDVYLYTFPNTVAGVVKVIVAWSANPTGEVTGVVSEWQNLSTCTADGGSGTSSTEGASGTSWTAGSLTPAAASSSNPDLVLQFAITSNGASNHSTITAMASPAFTLFATNGGSQAVASTRDATMAMQYLVTTSSSAVNPTITVGTAQPYDSVAIALASATQGTAPGGGIRILGIQHNNLGDTTSPVVMQFPTFGNLIVLSILDNCCAGTNQITVTAISSSPSNTWVQETGSPISNGDGGQIQMFPAGNALTGATMTITLTFTATTRDGWDVVAYDVTGAAATCLDTQATNSGNQVGTGSLTTFGGGSGVTFTPAGSGELVVQVVDHTSGTDQGISSPSGAFFDAPWFTGQDGNAGSQWTLDSGPSHFTTTSGSALTWIITRTTTAPGNWEAIITAFKAPAAGGCPPTRLLTGVGC